MYIHVIHHWNVRETNWILCWPVGLLANINLDLFEIVGYKFVGDNKSCGGVGIYEKNITDYIEYFSWNVVKRDANRL